MKKLFFTLMFTFLNSALAQNVEVVSLKQAEDILTYRAPTTAADVIGKWKKVLHGPTEGKMGQYNSQGINEGAKQKPLILTITGSNMNNWLPQEVSTVYAAQFQDFLNPSVNYESIVSQPVLDKLGAMAISQIGSGITFGFNASYRYKTVRSRTKSVTVIPWTIISIDYQERVEEDKYVFIELKYICTLQVGTQERLVCEQERGRKYRADEGHESAVNSQLEFPKVIAFERVK